MNQINRNLILPIIALIIMYMKSVAGVQLPDETADIITDATLAILALIGIFTNPKQNEKNNDK